MEIEIKNPIPCIITQKEKYLDINLTRYVQDLYAKNHRTPKKEIKENINR